MKKKIPVSILIVLTAACLAACTTVGGSVGVGGGGVGGGVGVSASGIGASAKYLKYSPEATAEYEQYVVRPDYNYYYSGAEAWPNAILGLDKRYALTNDLWKKVDLTHPKLKDWVQDMQKKGIDSRQGLRGYAILNEAGNRVGSWYSVLEAAALTRIRLEENNGIWIDTPRQDTYREFDRGFGGTGVGVGIGF